MYSNAMCEIGQSKKSYESNNNKSGKGNDKESKNTEDDSGDLVFRNSKVPCISRDFLQSIQPLGSQDTLYSGEMNYKPIMFCFDKLHHQHINKYHQNLIVDTNLDTITTH